MSARYDSWELLVVDDGSSDETAAVVEQAFSGQPEIRVLRHERNRGKGFALRSGFAESRGDRVLFTDADLATPIEMADRLMARLDDGADLAVASRVVPGARILTPQPWRRRLAGRAFRAVVRASGLTSVRDTQCGFKLLSRAACEDAVRRAGEDGFTFDLELLTLAERAGARVVEVPVDWCDVPGSKVRLFPDALRMFADVLTLRMRYGRRPS